MKLSFGSMIGRGIGGSLNTKRSSFGLNSLFVVVVLGIMFLGVGGYFYKSSQIDSSWTKIQGEVVDVDRRIGSSSSDSGPSYSPIVSYQVDNQNYHVKSNISTSSYPKIGSKKEVAYNPKNPSEAKIPNDTSAKIFVIILPLLGLVLVIAGPFLYLKSRKRGQTIQSLIQSGQKVTGVMQDIINTGSRNGFSTYKIVVAASDPFGKVTSYTSDNLTGMMGLAIGSFQGKAIAIDVYIDQANPSNYYVDISDIPSLTSESIAELVASVKSNKTTPQPPSFPTATPTIN